MAEILDKVIFAAGHIPVTLKIRTGWDKANKNAVRIGQIAENAGIQALTIHGRTRACKFNGEAEFESIAEVKQSINIPVIANGDITSIEKALHVKAVTQADGLMIGRGAQGNPWLIQQINQALAGDAITEPCFEQKCSDFYQHIAALHEFYGEYLGLRIARKHAGFYLENLGFTALKKPFNHIKTITEQLLFIQQLSVRH